jgi:uncharacterized protein with PIN domain
MGIKVFEWTQVHRECPNRQKHIDDMTEKFKDSPNPFAPLSIVDFTSRRLSTEYCEQCGASLIAVTQPYHEDRCEKCGERIGSNTAYCPHCGDRVRPATSD